MFNRAVGALPTFQRIEACLLRLIEWKLELCQPVESVNPQL
jgi:hypothetical protein